MVTERYANAYAEVLHYLNGINKESLEKIPKKLINMFEQSKNPNYVCNFDYNRPLKELKLLEETRRFNRNDMFELLV